MHIDAFRELPLDRNPGAAPLPVQLAAGMRDFVARGTLRPGELVPSTRQAAEALGVSRGTVAAAYDQLVAEEYLIARSRSGTVVNPDLRGTTPSPAPDRLPRNQRPPGASQRPAPVEDRPEWPDDAAWRSAWRRAVADGRVPPLDDAVAEHLRHMRGVLVSPSDITLTSGARSGLGVLLGVVSGRTGRRPRIAIEAPGFPGLRRVLEQAGAETLPLPVGADGPMLDALEGSQVDLALVTPNHQYPDGRALPARQRQALIDWANTTGTVLVEDDFDSERRHLGPPLPTLWSLAHERVAHLGTFSAVIGRGVGTGYLIAPASWRAEVDEAADALGVAPPLLLQRAVAAYLSDGGLRRRLARTRRRTSTAERELTFR